MLILTRFKGLLKLFYNLTLVSYFLLANYTVSVKTDLVV